MHEWKDTDKDRRREDLEERLVAHYGPKLPEQPLSSASWQHLHSRLSEQRSPNHWHLRLPQPLRLWHRSINFMPAYVQDTFSHIMDKAHLSYPQPLLRCSFGKSLRIPTVRVSSLGKHKIKLVLPLAAKGSMSIGQAELDVVVATGLARYLSIRTPIHSIVSVLVAIAMLLTSVASILFLTERFWVAVFPIAILVCAVWLMHIQKRVVAFDADTLMVQWLGRERICEGLHALADRSHSPHSKKWGEPSLVERIDRVCGTQVAIEEERLMLVR